MSGGSFDYVYQRTIQFADELRNKLQEQGKDPSGDGWPYPTWTTDVACKLAEIAAFADYVGALMKEAEWLYSGDTGEDTFAERVQQIEATRGVMRLEPLHAEAGEVHRLRESEKALVATLRDEMDEGLRLLELGGAMPDENITAMMERIVAENAQLRAEIERLSNEGRDAWKEAAIGELRRLSGLTWDQLARLFNVSRRSLHFWASGKSMAPSNEEHLHRILAVVRKVDQGSAKANRAMLLGVHDDGSLPFDLLAAGDYERVVSLLGPSEAHRVSPQKLTREARIARAPHSPEELIDALQDRIHRDGGAARAAKSVRLRGGR